MTISTTTIKISYNGNGSTSIFNFPFKIIDDDDIQVIIRSSTGTETVKTKTTHYTVLGVGDNSGSITFTALNIPIAGQTVILRRSTPQTQELDLIENDPLPANSIETAYDKLTLVSQELQEQVDRSIKLSRTNTMTSTEFTVAAADRTNKILAFDANGEISVTQELGTYRGNWAAATSYSGRDLVKDTSTGNIFIVDTAHTSSGSQPLTTNANSAFYELIVDAATSTSSATNAAASAAAAAASAAAAAASAVGVNVFATNAGISAAASAASASTSTAQAALATTSAANALTSETNAATSASAASTSAAAALASQNSATSSASTATTQAGIATTQAGNASTSATAAAASASTASSASSSASSSAATAQAAETNVVNLYDSFDDRYLGPKPSNPALDNDNNSLLNGALYFNSVTGEFKVFNTSTSTWSTTTLTPAEIINVNAVASQISPTNNIATVAAANANINTIISNISGINNFAERYRVSATAPTTSLDLGDLYFDTTTNTMKVFGSSGFVNAGSSVNGTADRFKFTAIAAQVTFTGADDNANILGYDAGFLDVYLNGIKLVNGSDFTASSGTSIVLATGATVSDILEVIAYGTFQLANFSITDANDVPPLGTIGQALVVNSAQNALEFQTIQASEITTVGNVFSNYNDISTNTTTTTASNKNSFLMGIVTVSGSAIWTVSGSGTLTIL